MAWYNSTGKENHKSIFDNVEYDRRNLKLIKTINHVECK